VLKVAAHAAGHRKIIEWLRQFGEVCVAVEDCRHLTRRLEADLLDAGHSVVRVHTRLMAGMRRSGREPGKSDPIDAEGAGAAPTLIAGERVCTYLQEVPH
jgi:transposase